MCTTGLMFVLDTFRFGALNFMKSFLLVSIINSRQTLPNFTGGRFIAASGHGDLCIRSVRLDDANKGFSCLTTNSLTGEKKLSEAATLSIKGGCLRRKILMQNRMCYISSPSCFEGHQKIIFQSVSLRRAIKTFMKKWKL